MTRHADRITPEIAAERAARDARDRYDAMLSWAAADVINYRTDDTTEA